MSSSKPIGQILVEKGYITQQQLDAAIAVQGEQQLGQVLINWNWITQEQLLDALNIQAPPPPPPPPPPIQQPVYQQSVAPPPLPTGRPDLTMDTLQKSKFKIDLKTLIYVRSLLVSGVAMYFTFMGELDSRFNALESGDKELMVDMDKRLTAMETSVDKRLTDLENTFTPIGEGVYAVDPNSTWPPTRGEYKMKDELSRQQIMQLQKEIEKLVKDIEKLEKKVYNGSH